jgi:hypothetical protein
MHDDDIKDGTISGGSGFRFVGMFMGAVARSRIVSTGLGAYGAASSVYYHFLARGRDVVYPKDMAMVIGLGTRESESGAKPPESKDSGPKDKENEVSATQPPVSQLAVEPVTKAPEDVSSH